TFFPDTSNCELLSHRSEGRIRWIKEIPWKSIGLMTRLNLSDSSQLLSIPTLQYQNIHDRVSDEISMRFGARSASDATGFVDRSIDIAIQEEDYVIEND